MTRRIDFRAWDKLGKKMLKQIEDNNGNLCFEYPYDTPKREFISWHAKEYDLEIMQYVGLKDSKGVQIYEGDVVTYNWGLEITTGVIKWDSKGSGFIWDTGRKWAMFNNKREDSRREVIGNIWENPELLKAK